WRALGLWAAFVAVCLALGAITGTKTLSNGAVGESARGYSIMDKQGLWGDAHELAYLHSKTLRTSDPAFASAIKDVQGRFAILGLDVAKEISKDHHSAVVVVTLTPAVPVDSIRIAIAAAQRANPGLTIQETGDVSSDQAHSRVVDNDLHRVELLAIPVT